MSLIISSLSRRRARQRGFGLLETFIGMVIGLFLLAGIVMVFSSTRQNFTAQIGMSQWQDHERTAMTLLTTAIEHAGYFYDPQDQLRTTAFPATAQFPTAGQVLTGTSGSDPGKDTLTVRFFPSPSGSSSSDFLEDCQGGAAGGASTMSINTFAINSAHELTCAVGSQAARALVGGITAFSVLYGVDSDGSGSVNAYLPASAMTPAHWATVVSVQVTLSFINPLDRTQPISSVRVINLMSRA